MRRTWSNTLVLVLVSVVAAGDPQSAFAQPAAPSTEPSLVSVGKALEHSKLPPLLAQGKFLHAQGVSAVDVSADGKRIAVTNDGVSP